MPITAHLNRAIALVITFYSISSFGQSQVFTFRQGVDGYTGVQDSILYANNPTFANGAGPEMFVGRTGSTFPNPATGRVRRGVVQFDLTSITAGSTVASVTLTFVITNVPPDTPGPALVAVHPISKVWAAGTVNGGNGGAIAQQGDVTWNSNRSGLETWTNPGGDFGPASATAVSDDPVSFNWSGPGLVADVQAWIDNPATNHGWILIGDESGTLRTVRGMGTSNGVSNVRPSLTVEKKAP